VQSERVELYQKYAGMLVDAGRAYYCFCSPERLDRIREEREAARSGETGYDRRCRELSPEEGARRVRAGEAHTIRLKIPLGETTRFRDLLLGDIEWKNEDINPDPVLLKSDGFPTYHLANVVDDHLMGISHVLRAQEWLPSTPLHRILYQSFGWSPPEFCHLPMVMGQDGKKLSKRHGATSVDEFRRQGYLPEALINYVALLGCSYEEGKDLYTLKELEERFSPEKLNKAPAVFDYKKLEWYNGQYIRMMGDEELAEAALPYATAKLFHGTNGPGPEEKRAFIAAMPLIKERISFLHEIPEKLDYLFHEPPVPAPEEFIPKKADLSQTTALLRLGRELLGPLSAGDDAGAEALVKAKAEAEGVKLGDLLMPLRVAVTGKRVSPPLFGSIRILGEKRCFARVERALDSLAAENR
jgi:glutamyl-tRNA synthetase